MRFMRLMRRDFGGMKAWVFVAIAAASAVAPLLLSLAFGSRAVPPAAPVVVAAPSRPVPPPARDIDAPKLVRTITVPAPQPQPQPQPALIPTPPPPPPPIPVAAPPPPSASPPSFDPPRDAYATERRRIVERHRARCERYGLRQRIKPDGSLRCRR